MRILLTVGRNPVSWLILKLTGEDASHMAMQWGDWVIHSTFFGVRWTDIDVFEEKSDIVSSLEIPEDAPKLLGFSAAHVGRSGYDFGALFYCGFRIALRAVGIQLPKKNLWAMTGMFLCTEFVAAYFDGEEDNFLTPRKLFDRLKSKQCPSGS